MRVTFCVGHEDTPEAYWRVGLPARHLRAAIVLAGETGAEDAALRSGVLWIHQPTSIAAGQLAERAAARGVTVVVDLSEDPWSRHEVDGSYNEHRLCACQTALDAADVLVVTSDTLAARFPEHNTRIIPAVVPETTTADQSVPPTIAWWSDGRQKLGLESIAAELVQVIRDTDVRVLHIGYPHMTPISGRKVSDGPKEYASRQEYVTSSAGEPAATVCGRYMARTAASVVSLDLYPSGAYRDAVSDLSVLRAAACGVPTLTTRPDPPPGCLSPAPGEWADTITRLIHEPATRRVFSSEGHKWAATRTTFDLYHELLEEVA